MILHDLLHFWRLWLALRLCTGAEEAAAIAALSEGAAAGGTAAGAGAGAALGGEALAGEAAALGIADAYPGAAAAFGAEATPSFLSGFNPYAVGAQGISAAMKYGAANESSQRRKSINNALRSYQTGVSRNQEATTKGFTDTLSPEARAAANIAAENEGRLGLERSVGAATALAPTSEPSGKVSDQYRSKQESVALTNSAKIKRAIENLSKMGSTSLAGRDTARRYGRTAGEVGAGTTAIGATEASAGTDISNVHDNALALAGADAISGIGYGITDAERARKLQAQLGTFKDVVLKGVFGQEKAP